MWIFFYPMTDICLPDHLTIVALPLLLTAFTFYVLSSTFTLKMFKENLQDSNCRCLAPFAPQLLPAVQF